VSYELFYSFFPPEFISFSIIGVTFFFSIKTSVMDEL
jgi:uncharacterized membrane protein